MAIYFRHETVRPHQKELMQDIYDAVSCQNNIMIQAPTGLGKTDAALSATLTYALENDLTVFFLTPKISQHKIAMDVVNGIAKKHSLAIRAVDLVGRSNCCIIDALKDLDNDSFQTSCGNRRKNKQCIPYINAKGHTSYQEKKADLLFRKMLTQYGSGISHHELMPMGRESKCCTYEWLIKLASMSNVIIADYYHMLIPHIRDMFLMKTKKRIEDSIIIVDEAHNLAPRIRSSLSRTASTFTFRKMAKEMQFVGLDAGPVSDVFVDWSSETLGQKREKVISGWEFQTFIEQFGFEMEDVVEKLVDAGIKYVERTNKKSACLSLAKFISDWKDDEFKCVRLLRKKDGQFYISKRLLDPSPATRVLNQCHSSVLMSGTLLPLEMHLDILGLDKNRTLLRSYPSPFDKDNTVNIITEDLTTRYSKRGDEQYNHMAQKLDAIINNTPGGTAIFFPSYTVLNGIVPMLKSQNLLIQQPSMKPSDVRLILNNFKQGGVLCGVQGGSLSIDCDESVFLRKDGIIFTEKIGSFVNRVMKANRCYKRGQIDFCDHCENYDTVAFDPKTFKLSFKPISKVIKHKIKEQLFEITLQSGRKIKATGSHSIFAIKNSTICSPKVANLENGDFILIPRTLPSGKLPSQLNFANELLKLPSSKLANIYVRGFSNYLDFNKLKKAGYSRFWKYRDTCPFNFIRDDVWKVKPKITEIHVRWGYKIKTKIPLTKELFRLLGYYVAEGHKLTGRHSCIGLTFGSHENDLIQDARSCIESVFGNKPSISHSNSSTQLTFGGKLARLLAVDVLKAGSSAIDKRIPPIVFTAPNRLKMEFLKGYFAGDGTASKINEISFKTISKLLASDLMYLLLQLGIFAGCTEVPAKGRNKRIYQIYVTNSFQLRKLLPIFNVKIQKNMLRHLKISEMNKKRRTLLPDAIPVRESGLFDLFKEAKPKQRAKYTPVKNRLFQNTIRRDLFRKTLDYIVSQKTKTISKETVNHFDRLIKSDFGFARIKSIQKVSPTSKYVYDISVKGFENFVGGFGGIILHNSEGVDYSEGEIKTVVIVGVALEEMDVEITALIDYYEEKFGRGWDYGYVYPGTIKALQAAGRARRKESDRVAVVYMDERFKWRKYNWILNKDEEIIVTDKPEDAVDQFWNYV